MSLSLMAGLCLLGCKHANVTSETSLAAPSRTRPSIVYVADFELGAENVKHQEGILSGRSGTIGRIGDRLAGAAADPGQRARDIVDLMANSLVKELSRSGFSARRVAPGHSPPATGWIIQGVFTEVQEGNRLRRAIVGFGEGQTDLQLVATIHDLSNGAPEPQYKLATDATSGRQPGAAPTIVLGPYGAAARFVMAGKDLENSVKQTAKLIAERVGKEVEQAKKP